MKIERLIILSKDDRIDVDLFMEQINIDKDKEIFLFKNFNSTLKEQVNEFEKEVIKNVLNHNKTLNDVASSLGIDTSTLLRKKRGISYRKS